MLRCKGVGSLLCEWIRVEAEGQVESSDMLICCIEGRYSVLRSTGTREERRESSDMIICCIKGCYSVLRSTGTVA